METEQQINFCISCSLPGNGNYCSNCGQTFTPKRLTTKGMIHDVFHFFTHLDKGLPYTIKKLITTPGKMQREYVEGSRNKHQKPFSMFFLSATIAALSLYWFNMILIKYYNAGETSEAAFFHQYWVVLQVCLLPLYILIVHLFFYRSGFNYAEVGVLQLYTFALLFFVLICIHLLKFIWPHLQTRYIELPVIIFYCAITNIHFFNKDKKLTVLIKTIAATTVCFVTASFIQDLLIKFF
jgi:hypothetical protein